MRGRVLTAIAIIVGAAVLSEARVLTEERIVCTAGFGATVLDDGTFHVFTSCSTFADSERPLRNVQTDITDDLSQAERATLQSIIAKVPRLVRAREAIPEPSADVSPRPTQTPRP